MNHIFIHLSTFFALGIITNYYFAIPFLWSFLLMLFLAPSLFLYKNEKRFVVAICLLFFVFGIGYHGVSTHLPENHVARILKVNRGGRGSLTSAVEQPIRTAIIGIICSPVETRRYSAKKTMTTFEIDVKKVRSVGANGRSPVQWIPCQGKIKVNAYNIVPSKKEKGKRIKRNNTPRSNGHPSQEGTLSRTPLSTVQKQKRHSEAKLKNLKAKRSFADAQDDNSILHAPSPNLQYGDEVRLWGEIKIPPRAMNPGQFDYRAYLKKYGIHLLMTVYGKKSIKVYGPTSKEKWKRKKDNVRNTPHSFDTPLDRGDLTVSPNKGSTAKAGRGVTSVIEIPKRILRTIFDVRRKIKSAIDTHIDYPYNTILSALLIGARSEVPSDIRDTFVKTGTIHMLSISGLHISIITGMLFFILARVGMRRSLSMVLVTLFLLVYTIFVGFRFPVMRSTCMGLFFILGIMLDRQKHSMYAVWIALSILLLMHPESLFLPSLQLSFITVLSIVLLMKPLRSLFPVEEIAWHERTRMQRFSEYLLSGYALSLAIMIGASPLVGYHFHIYSLVSFVANVFVLPLLMIIIVSGLLFCVVASGINLLGPICAFIPQTGVALLVVFLKLMTNVPGGFFYIRSPHRLSVVGYYFLLILLYGLRKRLQRTRMVVCMLSLAVLFLLLHIIPFSHGVTEIDFLSVGSRNCVFIQTPDKTTILINTGSAKNVHWTIKPFLMAKGIQTIDVLFITSWHKANWGGIDALADNFNIKKIYVPHGERDIDVQNSSGESVAIGDRFTFDTVQATVMHAPTRKGKALRVRDSAVCLSLDINGVVCLLYPDRTDEDFSLDTNTAIAMIGTLPLKEEVLSPIPIGVINGVKMEPYNESCYIEQIYPARDGCLSVQIDRSGRTEWRLWGSEQVFAR